MSETPTQNSSTTRVVSNSSYSKVSAFQATPDDLELRTDSRPNAEVNSGNYVRAYRAGTQGIAIKYNAAEIQARTVRREISKILES